MPEPAEPKNKNRRFNIRSIQNKLTFVIIFILIPVVAFLSILSYQNAKSLLASQIFDLLETIANSKQDQIVSIVAKDIELAHKIISETKLTEYLATKSAQTANDSQSIAEIIKDVNSKHDQIENIHLTDLSGTIVASTNELKIDNAIGDEGYFLRGLISFNIHEVEGDFLISGPVVREGETIAVIVLDVKPQSILSIVEDYRGLGTSGEILLGKRVENEVVFLNQTRHQRSDGFPKIDINDTGLPINLATEQLSGTITSNDYRGIKVFAIYRGLSVADWGLVVKIDSQEALMPMTHMRNELIRVSLLTLVLFILVAFVVSRSITGPLHRLNIGTEKIAKGEWDYKLEIKTGDEVEQLAHEFTHMAQELKGSYEGLEQKVEDRTAQLQKEKELSEGLASDLKKFQLAVENASDQIIITDPEGNVIYANRVVESNTGYSAKEIIGKNPGNLWAGEPSKKIYENMWKTLKEEKKSFEGEVTNKRKNGEEYIANLRISPILDKNNNVSFFVSVERDITLEKAIDRMKTEFISVASHQLRTPLSAIKWFTEMVLAGDAGEIKDDQREYLQQVYDSNERMIELVNSLLNVSRIEQGRITIDPQPTDLGQLVDEVLTELTPRIKERKLKVEIEKEKDLPQISIDPKLIRQVYANLLTNAVKYTPENGKVYISITKQGEEIISQVKDTGYGIPKNQQDQIFTKFFRADNIRNMAPDGSGLGLYIVKSVVESSGGRIWFESEEKKGTSFWFTLPIAGTPSQKGERTLEEIKY